LNDSEGKYLTQVDRRTDTWQDLEIPQDHKGIVQALVNTHFSKDRTTTKDPGFDLVREKGKGVVILLHGAPGVGKTATAECVAASYGKPLLPITCGDLGLKPKEVEATLQKSFQLAQAWDCVMLLDEADIFLAQRTNQDIERNALVSVFLRVLEYYEGIL
jgi:SpoVK/Ycf46/Vps4 family AAA+-type ATPase